MSPSNDPRVEALARDVERAVRVGDETAARVGELGEGLAAAFGRVGEIEAMVIDLAQNVTALTGGGDTPVARSWILADNPQAARDDLADLVAWLDRVYLRYPHTQLPNCWMWHPWVVEELLVLRHLHAAAYTGAVWVNRGTWHNQWLPGVQTRIDKAVGHCELALHAIAGQREDRRPAVAPLGQHADAVADAWTNTGLPPQVTAEMLAAARAHDSSLPTPPV